MEIWLGGWMDRWMMGGRWIDEWIGRWTDREVDGGWMRVDDGCIARNQGFMN